MLDAFTVQRFRSLRDVSFDPRPLTMITGANGSGKSSLYRSLALLQRAALGGLGLAVAQEGGLESIAWAGSSAATARARKRGGGPLQGTARRERGEEGIRWAFATQGCGFEMVLGMPEYSPGSPSAFNRDPGILREKVWLGESQHARGVRLERHGAKADYVDLGGARRSIPDLPVTESALSALREPRAFPELHFLRETMRDWRFYDGFRTDIDSALRRPRLGVRSVALASDGSDLAACVQSIYETGDADSFARAAKEGLDIEVCVSIGDGPTFEVTTKVPGMLRALRAWELSDGTLRYIALLAAIYSPRAPSLLVLNEPENSLHSSLLAPLGRAIVDASHRTQVWVVTHSPTLVAAAKARRRDGVMELSLVKGEDGAAEIAARSL